MMVLKDMQVKVKYIYWYYIFTTIALGNQSGEISQLDALSTSTWKIKISGCKINKLPALGDLLTWQTMQDNELKGQQHPLTFI